MIRTIKCKHNIFNYQCRADTPVQKLNILLINSTSTKLMLSMCPMFADSFGLCMCCLASSFHLCVPAQPICYANNISLYMIQDYPQYINIQPVHALLRLCRYLWVDNICLSFFLHMVSQIIFFFK